MERFVTFSEMSELLGISKTRLRDLIRDGIFPEPLRNASNNRPYFSHQLTEDCRQVIKTRVGVNGQPYTPNRKHKAKSGTTTNHRSRNDSLTVSLAGLGLNASAKQIDEAMKTLPKGLDEGEIVKQVFLRLRQNP